MKPAVGSRTLSSRSCLPVAFPAPVPDNGLMLPLGADGRESIAHG